MRLIQNTKTGLLVSTFALALVVSPTFQPAAGGIFGGAALAKDGSGGSGSGHDGGGSGGGDHSGSGDSGGDHSGSGSGGGGDNSGPGGNDDGANHDAGDDRGRDAAEHLGAGGAKVEARGNGIEVIHASGIKEEIEDGRYEMKDARGRTIVERRATAGDVARLQALLP